MEILLVKFGVLLAILGSCWCFMPGQTYKYAYTTIVHINRPDHVIAPEQNSQNGTVRLTADVEISALWERQGDYLKKLQLLSAQVTHANNSDQQAVKQLTTQPVYFSQKLGGNIVIHRFLEDTVESVNIKQGIINLLLYQTQPGTLKELDISGECDATYGREGHLVTKVKTKCKPRHITGQFSNPIKFWSLNATSTYKMTYDIDEMLTLKFASCEESHVTRTDMDRDIGSGVFQRQELSFKGSRDGPSVEGADLDTVVRNMRTEEGLLVESLLSSEPERAYCESARMTEASAVVDKYRDDLHKVNTGLVESARAFLNVVTALRQTNKAAILEILRDDVNYDLTYELIEACVAADTKDSQEALKEFLDFNNESEQEMQERYLLAMAFTTHPSQQNIERLKGLVTGGIASSPVLTSTLLALGAVLRTFYTTVDRFTLPLLTDTQNWLLEKLNACPSTECKIMYLGALRNAALPGAIPTVLYYAEHSEVEAVNLAALDALSRYDMDIMTVEAKPFLFRIYNEIEQSQPLTVRVAAVDHLLSTRLTAKEIRDLVESARLLPSNESTAYVIRRILDRASTDEYYRKILSELKTDTSIFNYDALAVPGNSTALTNTFLNSRDVGSTYSLSIEKTASGLLQKSTTDFMATSANLNVLPIVKVGIFTDGMDSLASYFGGSDETAAASKKEPSAGLRLALMGVGLRPIQFFSTQGEMMSAIWNAPSEPVSALQGNILLHDHSQLLSLSNGLTVDLQLRSSLSLDIAGAVSVSVWNRQSQSFVRNSASFALRGDTHLHSALFSLGMNFTVESSAELHFSSEVEFYNMPISMCMQMSMPEYEISVRTTRHASVPQQTTYRRTSASTRTRDGASFILDPRNTEQCNQMERNKQS